MGILLIALGLGYAGLMGYLLWCEGVSPSTRQVLLLPNGSQLPLSQPTPDCGMRNAECGKRIATGVRSREAAISRPPISTDDPKSPIPYSAFRTPQSYLPPERIVIARLGLDWPVVLSTNEQLPRFKGVGWLLGSG